MTPQQFTQVEEIFSGAKLLNAVDREAFLESSCAGDLEVLAEVRSLLAADESSGNVLSFGSPLAGRGIAMRTALSAGVMPAQIDRYHLQELIGEGGMGSVYRAEQRHPIRRTVAIKVIKLGCDTVEVIQRFEAERQALAMMDHPNIARVIDAGSTDAGRPYFVMEYVQGIPITQYCDNNRLTVPQRLRLFITVCQAIQHAHQKGIIHRDLKPSNVLVMTTDDNAVPKVIDFGVVKALHQRLTDETMHTQLGGAIGTPQYMSPEQADSDTLGTDTRSDIYSLGVMLYELLAGTTPLNVKQLRDESHAQMMQMIREAEPPKPSARLRESGEALASVANFRGTEARKLLRLVNGDLDWIVMKALEKDRSRRYETADGLGRDIERYLSDEPVEATPPSTAYKLRKFARKHRIALQVAALVATLLITGVIVCIWQAVRATRAEARAFINMTDMYTSRGVELNSPPNALNSLWFAKTATLLANDPQRAEANLIRANNWTVESWTPLAAVKNSRGADRLFFDPQDRRYLLSMARDAPPDERCRVWDLAKEDLVPLPRDFAKPTAGVWTPQGQLLLANSAGRIAMISLPDLKLLRIWEAEQSIASMAISRDGNLLAANSARKLFVWNIAASTSHSATVVHPADIGYVEFASGDRVVTASVDDQARVFSVIYTDGDQVSLKQTFEPVTHKFQKGSASPSPLIPQFMDDGRVLVTVEQLGNVPVPSILKWRDASSGRELASEEKNGDGPWMMTASTDGEFLLVTAGASMIYDTDDGKHGEPGVGAIAAAFDSPRHLLATGDVSGSVVLQRIDEDGNRTPQGPSIQTSPAKALAFSDDGQLLAVGGWDGMVRVWRLPDVSTEPPGPTLQFDGHGSLLAFTPDGRFVAPVGIMDHQQGVRSVQVFDVKDASPAGTKLELNAVLAGAAFSPDGRLIAVATGVGDDLKLLRIWDWRTGIQVCPTYNLPSEPGGVAYAQDGESVAVHCVDGEVLLINAADGLLQWRCVGVVREDGASQGCGTIQFSHDGQTLFTFGTRIVQSWDRRTGTLRYSLANSGRCLALAESPDNSTLAIGTGGGVLRFCAAADGRDLVPPIDQPGNVLTAAFSPDGRLLVTSCKDSQVRIWDVKTAALIRALHAESGLCDAVFTRDGRWILTTGYYRNSEYGATSRLWDVQTGFPITPLFLSTGGFHQQIDLSPDGRWAAIGGSPRYGVLIDLKRLTSTGGRTPQDALLWCEILSCQRIDNSAAISLTSTEWLDRWHQYRTHHPEFQPMMNDSKIGG